MTDEQHHTESADAGRGAKLSTKAAAARAGVSRSAWADYTSPRASRGGRRIGPAPDGHEEVSGYPYWYEASVDAFLDNRVGRGARTDLSAPPVSTPADVAEPVVTPDNAGRLARTLAAIAQVDPSRTGHTGPDTAAAYAVRNAMIWWALAEAQSAGVPAGIGYDPTDPRPVVVYLQLPTGQVSWHLPAHPTAFDGHNTVEKYARVDAYTQQHGLTGGTP